MSAIGMRRFFIFLACAVALLSTIILLTLHWEFVHQCDRDVDIYLEALKAQGLAPTTVFTGVTTALTRRSGGCV
jgi:hypothetical protein